MFLIDCNVMNLFFSVGKPTCLFTRLAIEVRRMENCSFKYKKELETYAKKGNSVDAILKGVCLMD